MKKLIFLLLFGCAISSQAQPYGEWSWHDHDLLLTSASYNVNIPGHLMAGHYIHGNDFGKFKLFKVDLSGSASVIFDEQYDVYADGLCQSGPALAFSDGISAIETSLATDPYAVSGAVRDGCFFATFDAAGSPQIMKYFTFPNNAGGLAPSQTTLIEIPSALGGGFLITGSYMGYINTTVTRLMYILQLDASGNLMQSSCYQSVYIDPCSNVGYELKPSSIIVSPYTPNGVPEIIVVGEANALGSVECAGGYVSHTEAFFMRVELNTLNWISNNFYRHSTTSFIPEKNEFKSVIPTSFGAQNSFLIGGYSETSSTSTDRAMMMVVDEIGNLQWSYIYNSSYSDTRACMQVVERISPTYGTTYYGAAISLTGGMLCFKVDGSGAPFTSTTPIDNYNEFNYQSGVWGTPFVGYQTNNLSFEPNPGNSEGIHVYGTTETSPGDSDNWYMVKASFNGSSYGGNGYCTNSFINNQLSTTQGPNFVLFHHVNQMEGLTQCPYINIVPTSHTPVPNKICSGMSATGIHSNNRTNLTTGIANNYQNISLSVSPNPAQNEIQIEFPSSDMSKIIRIFDLNGQHLGDVPMQSMASNIAIYNLEKLGLANGVYLIEIENEAGQVVRKKLVKE